MKIKNLLIALVFTLFSCYANATYITMINSDEFTEGNLKVCVYSDAQRDFTISIKDSQQCPHTKTFDLDEED